ncbi:protein of unknown function [Tenacibaculum sp. MAR_2009_124]|uniref:3-keto-disaccharide hydrolase n=1 Tax=Tenacibaculum sp. MAR_2009_124 TaxID=1250059 RepID=UPI000895FF76|nr:DUF1080 domain-containing protein [Tenacibaculum sp. MAR_2009_124]SEB86305.1 protein of unknown function [Tenacibaculum sp. MAR_2009_124]
MNNTNYFKAIVFTFLLSVLFISCNEKEDNFLKEMERDWFAKGNADWNFSNDVLAGVIKEGDGFIHSKKSYKNFILELEFKPGNTINSGVFIRCKNDSINPINCYEFNIWDNHPNQKYRTGAVVLKSSPLAKVTTIGKWNTYKIRCHQNSLQAWINGILVTDIIDRNHIEGLIGVQASGSGTVQFRKFDLILR